MAFAAPPPVQPSLKPETPWVIRDQAPPPPQAVYTQTRFTPYETDRFAKAYDWATNQTMLDYPGQRPVLERINGLIRQHMAATAGGTHASNQ